MPDLRHHDHADAAAREGIATFERGSDESRKIMAVETIDYNGYRLEVIPVGKGWRVSIYPRGSTSALRESPSMLEKTPKETVIEKAKKIVDAQAATN
jgi:hypothetical protein